MRSGRKRFTKIVLDIIMWRGIVIMKRLEISQYVGIQFYITKSDIKTTLRLKILLQQGMSYFSYFLMYIAYFIVSFNYGKTRVVFVVIKNVSQLILVNLNPRFNMFFSFFTFFYPKRLKWNCFIISNSWNIEFFYSCSEWTWNHTAIQLKSIIPANIRRISEF